MTTSTSMADRRLSVQRGEGYVRAGDGHDLVSGTHQDEPDELAYGGSSSTTSTAVVMRASAGDRSGGTGSDVASRSIVNVVPAPTAD